jgi:hypothetical protein
MLLKTVSTIASECFFVRSETRDTSSTSSALVMDKGFQRFPGFQRFRGFWRNGWNLWNVWNRRNQDACPLT